MRIPYELVEALDDETRVGACRSALNDLLASAATRLGAVLALRGGLRSEDQAVSQMSGVILADAGEPATPRVLAALVAALDHGDTPGEALPLLHRLLDGAETRVATLDALRAGPIGSRAGAFCALLLLNADEAVNVRLVEALIGGLGYESTVDEARAVLLRLLCTERHRLLVLDVLQRCVGRRVETAEVEVAALLLEAGEGDPGPLLDCLVAGLEPKLVGLVDERPRHHASDRAWRQLLHSAKLRPHALGALRTGLSHDLAPVRTGSAIVLAAGEDGMSLPILHALVLGLERDRRAMDTLRLALSSPSDRPLAIDALRDGLHNDAERDRGLSAALLLDAGEPAAPDLLNLAIAAIDAEPCMRALQRLVTASAGRQVVLDVARRVPARRPLDEEWTSWRETAWQVSALRLDAGDPATLDLVMPIVSAQIVWNRDDDGTPWAFLRRSLKTEARPALLATLERIVTEWEGHMPAVFAAALLLETGEPGPARLAAITRLSAAASQGDGSSALKLLEAGEPVTLELINALVPNLLTAPYAIALGALLRSRENRPLALMALQTEFYAATAPARNRKRGHIAAFLAANDERLAPEALRALVTVLAYPARDIIYALRRLIDTPSTRAAVIGALRDGFESGALAVRAMSAMLLLESGEGPVPALVEALIGGLGGSTAVAAAARTALAYQFEIPGACEVTVPALYRAVAAGDPDVACHAQRLLDEAHSSHWPERWHKAVPRYLP